MVRSEVLEACNDSEGPGVSFQARGRTHRPVVCHVTSGSSHPVHTIIHTPNNHFLKCENRFLLHSLIKDRVDYFAHLRNAYNRKLRDNSC